MDRPLQHTTSEVCNTLDHAHQEKDNTLYHTLMSRPLHGYRLDNYSFHGIFLLCCTHVQGKALCAASQQGTDPDWVELLLKNGCDIDFIDGDGKTALDVAANREVTSLLKVVFVSEKYCVKCC